MFLSLRSRPARLRTVGLIALALLAAWPSTAGAAAPPGRLSGVVRNATGAPQADAEVILVRADGTRAGTDTTGSGGRYSIAAPIGSYDLGVVAATSPVRQLARVRGVDVGDDTALDVVVLEPWVTLSGTVRDTAGRPVGRNVTVSFGSHRGETDDSGRYSLTAPAGRDRLSVGGLHIPDFELTSDRTLDLTDFRTTLTVRLVDERQTPIPGIWVWARAPENCRESGCPVGFELFPGSGPAIGSWGSGQRTDATGTIVLRTIPGAHIIEAGAARPDLLSATMEVNGPWPMTVEVVQRDTTPPPPPPAPDLATWKGIVRHNGAPVEEVYLDVSGEHSTSDETDDDGRFELRMTKGHHSLRLSAYIGSAYADDSGGPPPGLHIEIPDFEITADRMMNIDISTAHLAVTVIEEGLPVPGATVGGSSGGGTQYDDPGAPVEIFPGGRGEGILTNYLTTDAAGKATLLMFPGSPPVVWANAGNSTGSARPEPSDRSVTVQIRDETVTLTGTVRDARGPLPLTNWPWVSLSGPASRYEEFEGSMIQPDGGYDLQVQPGKHNLIISDEPTFDEEDPDHLVPTATLPQVWKIDTEPVDISGPTALDLTIPDAHPAHLRAVDTNGRPIASNLTLTTNHTIDVAPGVTGQARAQTIAASTAGRFDHMLFDTAPAAGWMSVISDDRPTPHWMLTLPRLEPGENVALAASSPYFGGDIMPPLPITTPDPAPTTNPGPETSPDPEASTATTGPAKSGYWTLTSDGAVFKFGEAPHLGNGTAGAVDIEPTPSGQGYWTLNRSGKIAPFGDATGLGDVDISNLAKDEMLASLSATPSGKGYWVFTNRGRAIAFGDAPHLGDMSGTKLNGPVLGSVATPSGKGYYMVASDGGIFAFGDAAFAGSMGGKPLNKPVQSLVPDSDGKGYWLVASDGGIFAFDAPFRGSMGGTKLNEPVVGMVRYGDGYLMVGADGGIFNFSTSPFAGSLGDKPPASPVVAVAALP